MSSLTVKVFGLHTTGADLTIIGECDDCGAELWRRKYVHEDMSRLGLKELLLAVQADVRSDRAAHLAHKCVPH